MGFNIDKLPTDKPSEFGDIVLADGLHEVTIEKCEYKESTTGNMMLSIVYKTKAEGKFIYDQIMDDATKQINSYRLGRLLKALNLSVHGNVELRDMAKVITKGKPLCIASLVNGKYTNIDIKNYDGYYPAGYSKGEVTPTEAPAKTMPTDSPTPSQASEDSQPNLDIAGEDETY